MESASNATTPWWCCGHGAQCCVPCENLELLRFSGWTYFLAASPVDCWCLLNNYILVFCLQAGPENSTLQYHATVLCVWTYCIYFWWDSPGAWYGIRLLLPDSFVLPNDLKSDSKSICAVHHHLRLWHAHFLVAEHRHYWHDDGRVSGEHFLLLRLVLHPDAGSGQLRLRMPCGKCNGAPLLSECFVLSRWNCLVHAELWSPLALQSGAALTVSRLLAGFTLGCP